MTTIRQQTINLTTSTNPHTKPRLSIVICTYNRRYMVLETLHSLRQQTLASSAYEVIVVDNGSSDETFEAVQTYIALETARRDRDEQGWKVQCLLEPHNGLAYARNTALQAASGEFAVFLDDDAIASPTFLEALLRAYEETGADAVGPQVALLWEANRPYWLTDNLLEHLGYFSPGDQRMELPPSLNFSSCGFSVSIKALQHIGTSSPLLSKRLNAPTNLGSLDTCERLRQAGFSLWYEPAALVTHRVPRERQQKAFFLGRAYWQGRAEILAQHLQKPHEEQIPFSLANAFETIKPELQATAQVLFVQHPLLAITGKPTSERLLAHMEQARNWGRMMQKLQLLERTPGSLQTPAVMLVHPGEKNAELLARSLWSQAIRCTIRAGNIPLAWLWRHRSYLGQSIAIIHVYRPGALAMNLWQRLLFLCQMGIAHLLGIHIVATDVGGWWQHTKGLRHWMRRRFEQLIFTHCNMVLSYTLYPKQLYPDKKLYQRVHCLPHPGLRGYYPQLLARAQAQSKLGLPEETGFVFLCLAHTHTEKEILNLIAAFTEAYQHLHEANGIKSLAANPQLLIVGMPGDKQQAINIVKHAVHNPAIHLHLAAPERDIPLYLGAANALIIPHQACYVAGTLEIAMLCYSYGRLVIAPNLPRFRGMLPEHATVSFNPTKQSAMVQALLSALTKRYRLSDQEARELDVIHSWQRYAQHLLAVYQHLLYHNQLFRP